MKLNLLLLLFCGILLFPAKSFSQRVISIDASSNGEKFDHFWSECVGAGRANEGLRASWLDQMKKVQENCGFKYCRFHGLFHRDMFVVMEEHGKIVYNWQYIDDLFDHMLDLKVRPFVELSFFPDAFASDSSKSIMWWKAKTTPGKNFLSNWYSLVKAFTQHCVDRYGLDEVSKWYFEVWNEPNIAFWDASMEQYFELYKKSALAVKSVNKILKVGGPATSRFVQDKKYREKVKKDGKKYSVNANWHGIWIQDFLEYCAKEKLPVDFLSTHPYPRTNRYVNSTKDDMVWVNDVLKKSDYPNAEIHLTEWSTSPSSRDKTHDFLTPAAYIVKANLDCIGLANSLSYWTFTDIFEEKGGASTIFHGGFGMINFQGIVKPSYHAYRMLNQLGDEKLYKDDYLFVSRNSGNGKISAIAYNYPKEYEDAVPSGNDERENGTSKQLNFSLKNLNPGTQFKMETLDKDHGNIYDYWKTMGSPSAPTREQVKIMKKYAETLDTQLITVGNDGILKIKKELTPWSVVLIKQMN